MKLYDLKNEKGKGPGMIKITNYKLQITNKLQIKNYKGGHGLPKDSSRLQNMTAFNKKFLQGGPGGAVFSKSAPPGRRRQK